MCGGRAAGGDDPEHSVGVQAGRVGGRELVGDHDRGGRVVAGVARVALGRRRELLASRPTRCGERRQHAPADIHHVGCSLGQQRFGQRPVDGRDVLGRVVPGGFGRLAAVDRGPGGLEQRVVVEQGQVRVEDLGLGGAGAGGDRVTVVPDRAAGGGDRVVEQRPFGRGVAGRPRGRRRHLAAGAVRAAAEPPRRPDRNAGRRRNAGQHVARFRRCGRKVVYIATIRPTTGGRCGGRGFGRRRGRGRSDPVAEAVVRQRLQSRHRVAGVRPGGRHHECVAEARRRATPARSGCGR